MHFLGGSFTYRQNPLLRNSPNTRNIIVEIRLHISNHYFICSPEQVNEHFIVYLIGEGVPYDEDTKQYQWFQTVEVKRNSKFYRINCISEKNNGGCRDFTEDMWAYCESANPRTGYSILRRQFPMAVERFSPLRLFYQACCWANATMNKHFKLEVSIETNLERINHSPYPYIPASYYVDYKHPQDIKVFASDLDGDQIICEHYPDTLGGFLTVRASEDCRLSYHRNRLGKQFGQFWIMDRSQNRILTRSLISVQIQVLKDAVCDTQPQLSIRKGRENTDRAKVKLHQVISLTVTLDSNCPLIQPREQTITELTTLCTNGQPVILATGGIEVQYLCKPLLCQQHHVCFVGEFALKLPSTKTECFILDVEGEEAACAQAAREYGSLRPRNRNFTIPEPISQNAIATKFPEKGIATFNPLKSTSTLAPEENSRHKTLILVALGTVAFLSLAGILAWKYGVITRIQLLLFGSENRASTFGSDKGNLERNTWTNDTDETLINARRPETAFQTLDSPHRVKIRTQHIQLGPLDEDDL